MRGGAFEGAEWPAARDPLRSSPTSHGFVPPPQLMVSRIRSPKFNHRAAAARHCSAIKENDQVSPPKEKDQVSPSRKKTGCRHKRNRPSVGIKEKDQASGDPYTRKVGADTDRKRTP